MGNIHDYLIWRGDIPFSVDPFNEVDNLILSELAYVDFENMPRNGRAVSLQNACKWFFDAQPHDTSVENNSMLIKANLMRLMIDNTRFRNTQILNYVNELDHEQDLQFAAVTFLLEDGTAFAAFRGTDHSFVGWKESLDLSYQVETIGQRKAVDYLNALQMLTNRPLRVGGHSKGGNLAVYGTAFCDPAMRKRIMEIYSNDGPGFHDEIIQSTEYQQILPKIIQIIPNASVVGRLMDNAADPKIVRSTALGLGQHNGFTWCVERNRFESAEISEIGVVLDKSVDDWADHLDEETRKSLVLSLYTLFEGTGKENFREIKGQKRKTLESLLYGMAELPDEKRQELIQMFRQFIRSGSQTVHSEINSMIEKILQERTAHPDDDPDEKPDSRE